MVRRSCTWGKGTVARAGAVLLLAAGLTAAARAAQLELLSKIPPRLASNTASGKSRADALSADGRYLVFLSDAPNVVPGLVDENQDNDVFLYDRATGTTTLVTRMANSPGTPAGGVFDQFAPPVISADGRYVAYVSTARNVVAGQEGPPAKSNVFLFDRVTGSTTLVSRSRSSARIAGNSSSGDSLVLSADGRWLAFSSSATDLVDRQTDTAGTSDVFLHDRTSGRNVLVSRSAVSPTHAGNGSSDRPSISADGRFVAFQSEASDLVAGQSGGEPSINVFLYDRDAGRNVLVSRSALSPTTPGDEGGDRPVISADGEYVAYKSYSSNLVAGQTGTNEGSLFLFQRRTGTALLVSHADGSPVRVADTEVSGFALSRDAAWVAFSRDPSESSSFLKQVYLYERATGAIRLVTQAYDSPGTPGNGSSGLVGISADGSQVAFRSEAPNLVDPATLTLPYFVQVFLYDRSSGRLTLASYDRNGDSGADAEALNAELSADGNWVAFSSRATNLEAGKRDLNDSPDVYLYGRTTAGRELVSRAAAPSRTAQGHSWANVLSADGRYAVFISSAPNLVPGQRDTNGELDVFLYDRTLKTYTLVSRSAAAPLQAGNRGAGRPHISADGRFVVYVSESTDLVPGQVDSEGVGYADVFLFDRTTGTNTLVSHAAGSPTTATSRSANATISADGSTVVFDSGASNLVPGQAFSGADSNVFFYDRASGAVTLVSHAAGSPAKPGDDDSFIGPVSADGRVIALSSWAADLLPDLPPPPSDLGLSQPVVYLYDRSTGRLTLVSRTAGPAPVLASGSPAALSADGRYFLFTSYDGGLVPGGTDGNSTLDVFLYDRTTDTVRYASRSAGSANAASGAGEDLPVMTPDGRYVVFTGSSGLNEPPLSGRRNVRLFDRVSGQVQLITQVSRTRGANGDCSIPVISANGRYIAFASQATNLTADPITATVFPVFNVFLFDQTTKKTVMVSRSGTPPFRSGNMSSGRTSSGIASFLSVSGSGHVLFDSDATNLVPNDYNQDRYGLFRDVFLYTP